MRWTQFTIKGLFAFVFFSFWFLMARFSSALTLKSIRFCSF